MFDWEREVTTRDYHLSQPWERSASCFLSNQPDVSPREHQLHHYQSAHLDDSPITITRNTCDVVLIIIGPISSHLAACLFPLPSRSASVISPRIKPSSTRLPLWEESNPRTNRASTGGTFEHHLHAATYCYLSLNTTANQTPFGLLWSRHSQPDLTHHTIHLHSCHFWEEQSTHLAVGKLICFLHWVALKKYIYIKIWFHFSLDYYIRLNAL